MPGCRAARVIFTHQPITPIVKERPFTFHLEGKRSRFCSRRRYRRGGVFFNLTFFSIVIELARPSKSDQPPPRRGHPHSRQPAVSWFLHLGSARFLFLQVALEPKSKLLGASGPGSSCRTWLAACVWERLALRLSWTCQTGLHWRPLKLHVIGLGKQKDQGLNI